MESVDRVRRGGRARCSGICNGFQVLCEAGLLPGALLPNANLRFICRQVDLDVVNADTAFTRACEPGERLSIPAKHTAGRYYAPDDQLDALEAAGQVVLRYAPGQNPNGSLRDIAGVTQRARQRLRPDAAPRARGRRADRLDRRAADLRVDGAQRRGARMPDAAALPTVEEAVALGLTAPSTS